MQNVLTANLMTESVIPEAADACGSRVTICTGSNRSQAAVPTSVGKRCYQVRTRGVSPSLNGSIGSKEFKRSRVGSQIVVLGRQVSNLDKTDLDVAARFLKGCIGSVNEKRNPSFNGHPVVCGILANARTVSCVFAHCVAVHATNNC